MKKLGIICCEAVFAYRCITNLAGASCALGLHVCNVAISSKQRGKDWDKRPTGPHTLLASLASSALCALGSLYSHEPLCASPVYVVHVSLSLSSFPFSSLCLLLRYLQTNKRSFSSVLLLWVRSASDDFCSLNVHIPTFLGCKKKTHSQIQRGAGANSDHPRSLGQRGLFSRVYVRANFRIDEIIFKRFLSREDFCKFFEISVRNL